MSLSAQPIKEKEKEMVVAEVVRLEKRFDSRIKRNQQQYRTKAVTEEELSEEVEKDQ